MEILNFKQYKSLKDLPGAPAGTVKKPCECNSNIYCFGNHYYSENELKQYSDWFAEVQQETLMDAVEKILGSYSLIKWWKGVSIPHDNLIDAMENLRSAYEREKGITK